MLKRRLSAPALKDDSQLVQCSRPVRADGNPNFEFGWLPPQICHYVRATRERANTTFLTCTDSHWIGVLYSILHPPSPKLGSIAILDLGNTLESADGIRILQEWIWKACDELLFSTSASPFQYIGTFIPEFMPVCTMAYDFDYERAQAYVPRARMYRYMKWPQCLTRPGLKMERHFIVRDFVQLLQGGPHHSLILGTLYLR